MQRRHGCSFGRFRCCPLSATPCFYSDVLGQFIRLVLQKPELNSAQFLWVALADCIAVCQSSLLLRFRCFTWRMQGIRGLCMGERIGRWQGAVAQATGGEGGC